MITYADTNALVQIYMHMPGETTALNFIRAGAVRGIVTCPVLDLLRFEVVNAMERMVFESRHGSGQRITPESALLAQGDFEADLAAGVRLQRLPLALADIEREFDSLVRRFTAKHGFRTYDIIHVASALKLKCRRFLSFDAKANALARLAGLKTL